MGTGRIAYQGVPGSYSFEACLALRPWDTPVGYETFDETLRAVDEGECDYAVLPVESSLSGTIRESGALIEASHLVVMGDVWRPIRLMLMAVPGAQLGSIRVVESHPVVLDQCRGTLRALGLSAREAFDTAGAARDLALADDPTRAVIAPASAAELYGLQTLRSDVQDSDDNRLRFQVLGRP
ncbi:MAG: prephenate dehydratase domain-containing protein [Brevundimonas sp.]|jgi:prephenate dehydratase|uniref:prephenate dehydratase domain-containing protein n=1 Tax=Brevundimonas sp. TaxID=1871086 RepID=UPI00391D8EFC